MANSPIYTSVPEYVSQNRLPLIAKTALKAKSASLFNLQTGIKTSAALNLLDTAVEFGDGTTCGWVEAGTQTLSQKILTTGPIKINMAYCDKEMLKYWTQYQVRVAAGQKELPFEEEFVGSVIKDVQSKIEKAIYLGDTDSADPNLDKFDGLIKILKDDAATVKVDSTTMTTAYEKVMAAYTNLPANALEGASILVGADMFRSFVAELVEKNLYHFNPAGAVDEIVLPGTTVKVISVNGLNGTSTIIAGQLDKNFFYGTDMVGDEEKFEFWYSQDNREFRLAIEFNAGVQVARAGEAVIVYNF